VIVLRTVLGPGEIRSEAEQCFQIPEVERPSASKLYVDAVVVEVGYLPYRCLSACILSI
jgi:hypothetical protein